MVPFFGDLFQRAVFGEFFQGCFDFISQLLFVLVHDDHGFIDFDRFRKSDELEVHSLCDVFHAQVVRIYQRIVLAILQRGEAFCRGEAVLDRYFLHDVVMSGVPVGEDFIDTTIRCVRYQLAAAFDHIFQALVFRCVFLGHVNFYRGNADRSLRYKVILFTTRSSVVAAGCHLRIAGFHHHILGFRWNSLDVQAVALQIFIDFLPDVVFIALKLAVFISPGERTLGAREHQLHRSLAVSGSGSRFRRSSLTIIAAAGEKGSSQKRSSDSRCEFQRCFHNEFLLKKCDDLVILIFILGNMSKETISLPWLQRNHFSNFSPCKIGGKPEQKCR